MLEQTHYFNKVLHRIGMHLSEWPPPKMSPVSAAMHDLVRFRGHLRAVRESGCRPFFDTCLDNIYSARAQAFQDLFVLFVTQGKKDGFFVDIGAADGIVSSNSYLLEKRYAWKGILCEPARMWHQKLSSSRSNAIDRRCAWRSSGETLKFRELGVLSTLCQFESGDRFASQRQAGLEYEVETVSMGDLLRIHGAPREIDYLSIDTEGSEYEILSAFDFASYRINIITVEHNYVEKSRGRLFSLLSAAGYIRVWEECSLWDDWYVHADLDQGGRIRGVEAGCSVAQSHQPLGSDQGSTGR